MDETIPPKKKDTIDLSINKKKLLVAGLVILALILVVLAIMQSNKNNDKATVSPTPTATASVLASPTVTATATATKTATSTPTSTPESANIDTEGAKIPAKGVLNAMVNRNLIDAKPHMTSAYYASLTQEGFAGTSSPARDHYDISSSQYFEGGKVYEVQAKMYMKLGGADAGYFDITLYVLSPQAGQFLVNNMTSAEHTS